MKMSRMIFVLSFCLWGPQTVGVQADPPDTPLHILIIGGHPDDGDLQAGGIAAKYMALGHKVQFVSMTNGDAGHREMGGPPLARRRTQEAHCAGDVIGAEYLVMDHHDGELMPTLENRREVIRLIREFQADVVITHRTNDYHPDHRYTGILVQDAMSLLKAPNIVPSIPPLEQTPVLLYTPDKFQKPNPFEASIAVSIDDVIEQKIDMIHCHESQMYESDVLRLGEVPEEASARRARLAERVKQWFAGGADYLREQLVEAYGQERGSKVVYAEGFEISEYGRKPREDEMQVLFPFW